MDKRHTRRVELVQGLFALGFIDGKQKALGKDDSTLQEINKRLPKIDAIIKKHAARYPLDRIAKTDLAILRLAIYELIYEKKNPPKVVIDEAVILAREFGNEKAFSFVNGVLGAIMQAEKKPTTKGLKDK